MTSSYSDSFLEEYVCELSDLCWAECRILNDSSITHEWTYRKDLITIMCLCL